ncbi:malonyl-CoA decarboxylase family protein [Tistrella sp. BH-R2-4]|uniref:Malonyl-CoA decarboxylase family protein n=1 Tax=Tistrella arctica TaxID=3133430 RepID=A0ABU9YHN3_9PROT
MTETAAPSAASSRSTNVRAATGVQAPALQTADTSGAAPVPPGETTRQMTVAVPVTVRPPALPGQVVEGDGVPEEGSDGAGFFDRTLDRLNRLWRDVSQQARARIGAPIRPALPAEDLDRIRGLIRQSLDAAGGEVSARARTAELGQVYLGLNQTGRANFLTVLAREFDVPREALDTAMATVRDAADASARVEALERLRETLVSPRARLLRQFSSLPQGVKFLVDLRADLLPLTRGAPALRGMEHELREVLSGMFDIGLLDLTRITWDAPAALLEKLIEYEAVHEIRSWSDLRNRLESDRRCYAFFHPKMPREPLIFVEVALVKGLADNVHTLLDEAAPTGDPASADTAIFYSISNAQKGLAGFSFGNFLIKRVVEDLSHDLPGLKTFATLSPIPGFRTWLDERLAAGDAGLLSDTERGRLRTALSRLTVGAEGKALPAAEGTDPLARALACDWPSEPALADALKLPLTRLAARYITQEKARNRARDGVAHFHLSNGARVERINWRADMSDKGLRQSAGMMVNYLYKQGEIEDNHEAYTGARDVRAGSAVRGLLR